jgi:hypothetical protein
MLQASRKLTDEVNEDESSRRSQASCVKFTDHKVRVAAASNRPLKTGLVAGADCLIRDVSQWRATRVCGPLQRCPGAPARSPRGTVGRPSGLPNPPTIRTQGPRPGPLPFIADVDRLTDKKPFTCLVCGSTVRCLQRF